MKVLNKRQLELFNLLAMQTEWMSAIQVAELLRVSVSTLRRDIEAVNEFYVRKENKIISKPGLGLKLEITGTLPMPHDSGNDLVLSILKSKRLIGITTDLLSYSPAPLSVSALSEKYSISRSSIVEDLKKIESWVARFSLKVIKNHTGTYIEGKDYNIRMAFKEIITYSVISNYQLTDSRIDRFSRVQLIKEFGEENVANCMNLISLIEDELCSSISEPYYTNLFSHLLETIRRTINHNRRKEENYDLIRYADKEWTIAERAVKWLEGEYKIEFPSIEIYYIYQYVISSGRSPVDHEKKEESHDGEILDYAENLTRNVSTLLNIDLSEDPELRKALVSHIKPMLNRLNYGIMIHNPILEDIKNELGPVFNSVREASVDINKKQKIPVPSDDEIAYLSVYIQAAIERTIERKKVILVCSSGIGASQLLSSRIMRTFPEWEIVDIVSGAKLKNTLAQKKCDLIISTIRLQEVEPPVAYVTALFTKKDIVRVIECLGKDVSVKEKYDVR